MTHLFIATGNTHKTQEMRSFFGENLHLSDLSTRLDLPEIEENGSSFLENATLKAVGISEYVEGLVLSDDSGLEVDALNGAPGIYSARYAGPNASTAENNQKLLTALADTDASQRSARFHCVIVIAKDGKPLAHFHGTVEGRIIDSLNGTEGFGYDPLFIPDGYNETFGELGEGTKNIISHRAKALVEAKKWLQQHSV